MPFSGVLILSGVSAGARCHRRGAACAGLPLGVYFRNIDHSSPDIQRKMAQAFDAALDADYISRELSPPTWLSQLQTFAAEQQPASVGEDGTIAADAYYDLLDRFLVTAVRNTSLPA